MTRPASPYGSYLEMYQREHGEHVIEKRLLDGRDTIGVFLANQPPGDYPDAPTKTYNIQMGSGPELKSIIDLGAGSFDAPMKRNEFVLSPPNTPCTYDVHTDATLLCLGVPATYIASALEDLDVSEFVIDPFLKGVHSDVVVKEIVRECWREANNDLARGGLFADAAMMTLALRLIGISSRRTVTISTERKHAALDDVLFKLVVDFVEENLETGLRMKTLAGIVGMNPYTFARAFKVRTGHPPYQWVIDRRTERAKELLRNGELSLASIAFACGFSSQAHMTTVFSERVGVTPAVFRSAR